jgi:hypothetical protein
MKKWFLYLLPVLIISLFLLIMNSGGFLKRPLGQSDNFVKYLAVIRHDVETGNWYRAKAGLVKLRRAWTKIVSRIQYSVRRDEIIDIDTSLASLRGSIEVKEKTLSLIQAAVLGEYWESLGRY